MFKKIIKSIIPKRYYEPILKYMFMSKLSRKVNIVREKYGYCIVFIATPLHGNLGDHAIVYSQIRFFKDLGLDKHIVEIPSPYYQNYSEEVKKLITDKDLIIIDGGGNMGTLWLKEEYKMRQITQEFAQNTIIIFPQTIFYTNDSFGREEFKKSAEIYNKHKNLYICAREKVSYDLMKKNYTEANILHIPDIVLYLNNINSNRTRSGAILCFRGDKEKELSNDIIIKIKEKLRLQELKISYESTVIPKTVRPKNREKELQKKWKRFASAEIVITDRLHGMIFAAITGTPCLAFDNSSKKVGNVYKWISYLPYIKFFNNDEDVIEIIEQLLSYKDLEYNNEPLENYYKGLVKVLKK